MKKRIMITGASGFLGQHLLESLYQKECALYPLSSSTINLFNRQAVYSLLCALKPTHLIHLAWDVTPGVFWESAKNREWVDASFFLIKTFVEQGGQRVIVTGSCAEYEPSPKESLIESGPFEPATLYGKSKRELFCKLQELSINFAWAYLFHFFGEYEKKERLIPSLITTFLKRDRFVLRDSVALRDFLYVKDSASALIALLESDITGGINIGSGKATSIGAIARHIARQLDAEPLLDCSLPEENFATPSLNFVPNTRRLTEELKWSPTYDLEKGIEESIAWWKNR